MGFTHRQCVLTATLLVACAGQESEPTTEPGVRDQDQEPLRQEPDMSSGVRGPATLQPAIRGLDVSPIDIDLGEDGHGQLVTARRSVALDIRADAWPGRALDPVLYVGQELLFRRYSHPSPGVLRFVAADASALPAGVEVFLGYDDNQSARVLVTSSLEVH